MPRTVLVRAASAQTVESKTPVKKAKRPVKELPIYAGSARAVQDSEWRVYVRDHGPDRDKSLDQQKGIAPGPDIDITLTEWALANLYGTYGNWGQKAYPSDRWIAKKFHVKPETVSRAREGLLAKGLIRCLGLAPNGQTNQFMYCLTLPVTVQGVTPDSDHQLGVDVLDSDHRVSPNGSRVPPETDHRAPRNGAQDIQELDKERRTSTPAGPVDDAADTDSFLPLDLLEKDVKANLETLAGLLGVKPRDINVRPLAAQLDKISRVAEDQYSVTNILETYPESDPVWPHWQAGRSPVGRMLDDLARNAEDE